jgi:hypothetical protein
MLKNLCTGIFGPNFVGASDAEFKVYPLWGHFPSKEKDESVIFSMASEL